MSKVQFNNFKNSVFNSLLLIVLVGLHWANRVENGMIAAYKNNQTYLNYLKTNFFKLNVIEWIKNSLFCSKVFFVCVCVSFYHIQLAVTTCWGWDQKGKSWRTKIKILFKINSIDKLMKYLNE